MTVKITDLPADASPTTDDVIPVVDLATTTTKKATLASLPISTATQTALNLKANLADPTFTGTVTAPTISNTTITSTTANVTTLNLTNDLAIANGGTAASTALAAFDNLKQSATDAYVGAVELATTAEVQTGTDTARAVTPSSMQNGKIVTRTAVTTTSGTVVNVTSVPAWVKRITITLQGVSFDNTSTMLLQIGDSGGIENTGYVSSVSAVSTTPTMAITTSTAGFITTNSVAAANTVTGTLTITLVDSTNNTWACIGTLMNNGNTIVYHFSGVKSLSATLDRFTLTTTTGTPAFDAGTLNYAWE